MENKLGQVNGLYPPKNMFSIANAVPYIDER